MAEGLDGAADAFRATINPQAAERPRDTGTGRFVATRPESMFEPRPVEGDPLTGDTRDGGEDARLAAAERRVADGRAEEGDEQSLQNRARSRNAANDNRHLANDNARQPERVGSEEPEGQDLDRADSGAEAEGVQRDADGNAIGDAEGEGGEGSPRYEVVVDGQRMEVSLPEALRGYIREATFHQRMNKVAEARQAVEQEAANIVQARDYYVGKLQFLERTLAELMPPQPDWDREFAVNPQVAHEKQKAFGAIYNKIAWSQAEQQRTAQEAAAEYDRNSQKYAIDQFSQFVAEAGIRDEKALGLKMSRMRAYAKLRGFSEPEIATVYDKRMLHVLDDATEYHQAMAARPKAVMPGKGKALTPGAATPLGNAGRRTIDDAQRKLAQTGRLDDAALLFERLIR